MVIKIHLNTYLKLPQMDLLGNNKEILEKYNKIVIKFKVYLKKNLIVNQCIMINILKLKYKFPMIEYIQIFRIIKYQMIMKIAHVYL